MEVIRGIEWNKPIPDPDAIEAPFYAAASRGELLYQLCPACEHVQFYPRGLCTECGTTPEWATASGRGEVYTFTVIRQTHSEAFKNQVPYAVAMIELAEGVKMMGNLTDCPIDEIRVGMAVEAYALEVADDFALPFWRPLTATSG